MRGRPARHSCRAGLQFLDALKVIDVKIPRLLPGLTRKNFLREALAGVTLLAIAVPLNIGYAQIAGLPATAGLYAMVVPTIVYALTVSSRQLVLSPDAAASSLVFSSLVGLGVAGENFAVMACAQAILAGLILFLTSFLKLGFLANFLSKPILVGFVGGLALEVLLSQIAKMLGIKIDSTAEFAPKVLQLFSQFDQVQLWSLTLSVGAVAILVLGRKFAPVVPWALIALVLATTVTAIFGLEARGVDVLGAVESGPPQFVIPKLSLDQWLQLIPSALALAMITISEGLLVSRAYAQRNGYPVNLDRDLFAFGAANVAAGLTATLPMGSSPSRTAAMDRSGSVTQLPSIVAAICTGLLLLFGTDILSAIPSAAIGAVVAVAVFSLLGFGEFRQLWRQSRSECFIGLVCFVGVLAIGPINGLFLAFVLALVNMARKAAKPDIDILAQSVDPTEVQLDDTANATETEPGLIIMRMAAPIFFANGSVLTERIMDAVENAPHPVREFVLDMRAVSSIDVTGLDALAEAQAWLAEHGINFSYSRLLPDVREWLDRLGFLEDFQEFDSNTEARAAYREQQQQ